MRNLLVLFAGLIFSSSAFAGKLSIQSITGVSAYNVTSASATVFGGVAGYLADGMTPSCRSSDHGYTCDSCLIASCKDSSGANLSPLCACNRNRIYDDLPITVRVKQSGPRAYMVRAFVASTIGTIDLSYAAPINPNAVTFNWRQVCSSIAAGASCELLAGGSSIVVSLYLDKDNSGTYTAGEDRLDVTFKIVRPDPVNSNIFGNGTTEGIGAFVALPGDGRIYLSGIQTNSAYPSLSYGSTIKSVLAFVSNRDLEHATSRDAMMTVALPVDAEGRLKTDHIDGLQNGHVYFVRLAMQDEAGNIVQHFPDMMTTKLSYPECFGDGASEKCQYAARPTQKN